MEIQIAQIIIYHVRAPAVDLPSLKAEFTDIAHTKGIISFADPQILIAPIINFYLFRFCSSFR